MELAIRRMQDEDVPAVFQLDRASFSLPWTELSYLFEIHKNENSIPLVAYAGTDLAGFIVVWQVEDEAHIGTIAVAENARRSGVARSLIYAGLGQAYSRGARKAFLEVRAGNTAARRLYESLGFVDFDLRKRYYADNHEDAVIMLLDPLPYMNAEE